MATKKVRTPVPMIVTGDPRERYTYENDESGKSRRTDARKTDEQGRPLSALQGFGFIFGGPEVLTIEAPDAVIADLSAGQFVLPQGSLRVRERGGDFGSVVRTVEGVESVQVLVEDAEGLFDQMARGGK